MTCPFTPFGNIPTLSFFNLFCKPAEGPRDRNNGLWSHDLLGLSGQPSLATFINVLWPLR